ncbi:MAG: hypothetical protein LBR85_00020 [Oscillospiraceae bacterium]|nr:hypothetical protein [Oscillospiraceae bacterium]
MKIENTNIISQQAASYQKTSVTQTYAQSLGGISLSQSLSASEELFTLNSSVIASSAQMLGGEAAILSLGDGQTQPDNTSAFGAAARDLAQAMNVDVPRLGLEISRANENFQYSLLQAFFGRMGFNIRIPELSFGRRYSELAMRQSTSQYAAFAMRSAGVADRGAKNVRTVETSTEVQIERSLSFSTKGSVKTSDGRTISIDLNLNMSESFYAKNVTRVEQAFMDPLVVNFGAPAAALSGKTFSFDIDSDGKSDQISSLASGSGFLALDLNNDGKINNGKELFGTESGNGFADLAKYDKDGNNWIDENDEVYDKLRIWSQDSSGKSTLAALGEVGVGAIYLGSAAGDYALGDPLDPDAMIRSTGIFLSEDGKAGTVQQVDFKV